MSDGVDAVLLQLRAIALRNEERLRKHSTLTCLPSTNMFLGS